jgi:hypothetical protein
MRIFFLRERRAISRSCLNSLRLAVVCVCPNIICPTSRPLKTHTHTQSQHLLVIKDFFSYLMERLARPGHFLFLPPLRLSVVMRVMRDVVSTHTYIHTPLEKMVAWFLAYIYSCIHTHTCTHTHSHTHAHKHREWVRKRRGLKIWRSRRAESMWVSKCVYVRVCVVPTVYRKPEERKRSCNDDAHAYIYVCVRVDTMGLR